MLLVYALAYQKSYYLFWRQSHPLEITRFGEELHLK